MIKKIQSAIELVKLFITGKKYSQNGDIIETHNNSALKSFITELKQDIQKAKSIDEIESSIDKAIHFPYQLKYNNRLPLLLLFFASIIVLFNISNIFSLFEEHLIIFIIIVLIIISIFMLLLSKIESNAFINELTSAYNRKVINLLYKFKAIDQKGLDDLLVEFKDFLRGNYSNELVYANEMDCLLDDSQNMRVILASFKYVNERIETYTENEPDGRGGYKVVTKTRKVYDTFYRSGIITQTIYPYHHIYISKTALSPYQPSFSPSSLLFKKFYKVRSTNDQLTAKLLSPAIVEILNELGNEFNGLTIEFSPCGRLLISQNEYNLFQNDIKTKINTPIQYKEDLLNSKGLISTNKILYYVKKIHHYIAD